MASLEIETRTVPIVSAHSPLSSHVVLLLQNIFVKRPQRMQKDSRGKRSSLIILKNGWLLFSFFSDFQLPLFSPNWGVIVLSDSALLTTVRVYKLYLLTYLQQLQCCVGNWAKVGRCVPPCQCHKAYPTRGSMLCQSLQLCSPILNKKLSYHRVTARCVLSVVFLPIATQQCRNYLRPLREQSLATRLRIHMADPCTKSEVSSVSRC